MSATAKGASSGSHSLLEQRPLSAIVTLAAPTTAVMLIAAASNALSTYFVSLLGDESIAAVSLVFPISMIVTTVMAGGLGTGVASAVARALGAGRVAEAGALAEHALALAAVLAVLFTALLETGAAAAFRAMGGEGEVLRQATLFGRTLFAGLALMFLANTCDSIMRGEGNVRTPAMCATLSLGLQIVLTPLFMFTAGLGLIGAPLGTLTGILIGVIPRVIYVFRGYGAVHPRLLPRTLARRHFADILRVGLPASLAAALNYVSLIVLTGILARFGNAHLAAYGLGTRFGFLLFALGYGVAVATVTLVGMATGAHRPDLANRYVRNTALLVAGVIAVPAAVVTWHPSIWLGIFTDSLDIHQVGAQYFRFIGPSYVFAVAAMVFASAFQGLGKATIPLAVVIIRVVLVVGAALALTSALGRGATAVFIVIAAGNLFSSLSLGWLLRIQITRHRTESTGQ